MASDRPFRIVHMSSVHRWNDTRIFWRMCRGLAKDNRFDVHWVVTTDDTDQVEIHDGVTVHPVPKRSGRINRAVRSAADVFQTARAVGGDLFHLHDPELLPQGWRLRRLGKKVIYDAHEDLPDDIQEKPWLLNSSVAKWVAKPIDIVERNIAKRMSGVITADEEIERRFRNLGIPSTSIHNYPDLDDFQDVAIWKQNAQREAEQDDTHVPYIVTFGGVSKYRCIDTIVDAVGRVPDSIPFKLVVGGNCDSPQLMDELRQLPGFARMDYVGWMTHDQMRTKLAGAAISIVLYSRAKIHMRIRSNRFFESLACQVPVITADFPEWKRAVQTYDCGIPVSPEDADSLATAIATLLTDCDTAKRLGQSGRNALTEHLNWEAERQKLIEFYLALLA